MSKQEFKNRIAEYARISEQTEEQVTQKMAAKDGWTWFMIDQVEV